MARKLIDISDAKRGGESTKARHGSAYYDKIGALGREAIKKKDPDFYKRLAAAGFHARQVKVQTRIAKEVGERLNPSAFDTFAQFLTGKR